jgi:hypothetical protein
MSAVEQGLAKLQATLSNRQLAISTIDNLSRVLPRLLEKQCDAANATPEALATLRLLAACQRG